MIAVEVIRNRTFVAGVELVAELLFNGREHRFGGPAVAHEQVLDAGTGAVLTQGFLLTEDLADSMYGVIRLFLGDERVQAHREMRFRRKPSTYAQAVPNLFLAVDGAFEPGERNVIDFGIAAPDGAARDGNLELARQVVELRICRELVRDLHCKRSGIKKLLAVNPSQWAARDAPHRRTRPWAKGRSP